MPSCLIKFIEVIAPVKLKLLCVFIVIVDFDVVVKEIPGHVRGIEALTP